MSRALPGEAAQRTLRSLRTPRRGSSPSRWADEVQLVAA